MKPDCKYAIDVEEELGQTTTQISSNVKQFADHLTSNGKEACIYTNDYFYSNRLDSSVKCIPLWVAHYGVSKPDAVNYVGFQYSSSGNINGVNGLVDLNDFSSGIFITSRRVLVNIVVNIVVKSFHQAVNLIGITDANGNKLAEDGINGVHTKEVIKKVLVTREAKNEVVRFIQRRLIALGFPCGKTGADANFGASTLIAVQRFQISRGLKADGIVGPLTISKLLNE